jgi:hypothetical protein
MHTVTLWCENFQNEFEQWGANRLMVDRTGGLSKTMKLDRLMSSHGKELQVTDNFCHYIFKHRKGALQSTVSLCLWKTLIIFRHLPYHLNRFTSIQSR